MKKNKVTKDSYLKINRPEHLNSVAAAYWNRLAPLLIERGHLNALSVEAFAELCDLYSRLIQINTLLNKDSSEIVRGNKEGALSKLKKGYSKQFLDYQRQFYLTPLANRGDFHLDPWGVSPGDKKNPKDRFFKDEFFDS